MKQFFFLGISVLLAVVLWLGACFIYNYQPYEPLSSPAFIKSRLYLPGSDFEENLIFFLAGQLGIYEGEFEVLDMVNLELRNIAGMDYLLITLRTPNGDLCQVTIAKDIFPWTRWEIVPSSFTVVRLPEAGLRFAFDAPQWMRDLGITPEQVAGYFAEHPDMRLRGRDAFVDPKTQKQSLPVDWPVSVKKDKPPRFSVNKNKKTGFSSVMADKNQVGLLNAYWKADYPVDYSGPGYRAYLYGKGREDR
ncbi:MAG: hypothetical protein PHC33_03340 [Candidatus Omnitrophica bacterium]|nr:hypothetical protein [Candidatus Omnitrophota bacterium]